MAVTSAIGFTETPGEIALDSLPVSGVMPEWLRGTLVRNGPGSFRAGQDQMRHWFDGIAMLHRFSFHAGRIAYANRFLDTSSYRSSREAGRMTYSEFATDPCRGLFGRLTAVFSPRITDNAKVNVARIGDRFLALAETPIQVEFDPETLRTAGVFQYEQRTVGQMTTVHPHFDTAAGESINLVTRYHALSHYNIYRVTADGTTHRAASVPVLRPAYLHSFGMTENYFILVEFPLVVNSIDLLLWLRPYIENFRWQPQRGARFTLIDRHSGQVKGRYDCDAFFAFHHINAFERDGELVADLCAYDDASIIQHYYLNRLRDEANELPGGTLRRYRIPLQKSGGRISGEVLSDACMELPRFDIERYARDGAYRYVYACGIDPANRRGFYNQIVKVDTGGGRAQTWSQPGCYPGEPVFVSRPGGSAEDDGVLLSVVLDARKGNSFLLVLDAASCGEIARAEVPHPVLFGYHGEYFGANA